MIKCIKCHELSLECACMTKEFINAIHSYINYWDSINEKSPKEKMEGLAFSILCLLDGVSGQYSGDITDLVHEQCMIHDMFYRKGDK